MKDSGDGRFAHSETPQRLERLSRKLIKIFIYVRISTSAMHEQPSSEAETIQIGKWREFRSDQQRVFHLRLEVGGEKAGEIVAKHTYRLGKLYVEGLFVERRFRGRGFGSRLLSEAEGLARRLWLKEMMLEPSPLDESFFGYDDLVSWYLKRGFRPSGRFMCKSTA